MWKKSESDYFLTSCQEVEEEGEKRKVKVINLTTCQEVEEERFSTTSLYPVLGPGGCKKNHHSLSKDISFSVVFLGKIKRCSP